MMVAGEGYDANDIHPYPVWFPAAAISHRALVLPQEPHRESSLNTLYMHPEDAVRDDDNLCNNYLFIFQECTLYVNPFLTQLFLFTSWEKGSVLNFQDFYLFTFFFKQFYTFVL